MPAPLPGWRLDMNVIEFFEYLAAAETTRDLAHQLADAWVEQEFGFALNEAA
jgi:hypothetical protein